MLQHALSDCIWLLLPRLKGLDALAGAWEYEYMESKSEAQLEACQRESDTCTHFDTSSKEFM